MSEARTKALPRRHGRRLGAPAALLALSWLSCGRLVDYRDAECPAGECAVVCNTSADCPNETPHCARGVCGAMCVDADDDGVCLEDDCDDALAVCGIDCSDADDDGVADCKDTCVDVDGDRICASLDCDDDAVTGASCSSGCTTAYVDRDHDGHGGPQGRSVCALGAGVALSNDDCADQPGADPRCGGLDGAKCTPGRPEACGDGADNDCNGAADCAESACEGQACDDGAYCTATDVCRQGACVGSGDPCGAPADADCTGCDEAGDRCGVLEPTGSPCDDGVFCNGTDSCDAAGQCSGHAGDPCQTSACSGTCGEGARSCSDVSDGHCFIEGACYADGDRNPANPCQECRSATSRQLWSSRTGACDDGEACTYNDACTSGGVCTGTVITCSNDASACGLRRTCNGTAACSTSYPGSETTCNDGQACTHTDRCNGTGGCSGTSITCSNDAGPCGATRSCNGTATCSVAYPGTAVTCNDDAACTHTDRCNGLGGCAGTTISCTNDPGPCGVVRSCNGTATCGTSYPGTSTSCDDGNLCTHSDRCNGSGGCGGTNINCNSSSSTCGARRACNGTSSCTVTYPDSSVTCNDSQSCTYDDRCNGSGSCRGTSVSCVSEPGQCSLQRWCNGTSTCSEGYPNGAGCDDGDPCTWGDSCNDSGGCVANTCGNGCGGYCTYWPATPWCGYGTPPFSSVWCCYDEGGQTICDGSGSSPQTRDGMTVTQSCACQVTPCSDPNNDVFMDPSCASGQYSSHVCCKLVGVRDCNGDCAPR